jgi:hypothetical protein
VQARTFASTRNHNPIALIAATLLAALVLLGARTAQAADPVDPRTGLFIPQRDTGWDTATTITSIAAMGIELLSPRTFSADPEVTTGWKARWHVSVLAPIMTLTTVAFLNENNLKRSFGGFRPGCGDYNKGGPGCESFGMLSTESLAAFSALGHGTGVFLVDTIKWSKGDFHGGAFTLEVGVPLVLAVITGVGRTAGNWETGAQVWGSGAIGFGLGLGLGALYSLMQRPECGYTGSLVCW